MIAKLPGLYLSQSSVHYCTQVDPVAKGGPSSPSSRTPGYTVITMSPDDDNSNLLKTNKDKPKAKLLDIKKKTKF